MKLIKKIFGYCGICNRWFVYPKRKRMSTMYHDEESNYIICCKSCFIESEKYWDEMWKDYYSR